MAVNGVSAPLTSLTAKQGAALTSSYGSNSMGEVSTGTASTALTGQPSQPTDAARQLFIVDDTALTGHASHSAATHDDEVSTGAAPSALTGQRGQPTEAARQPFWHGSSGHHSHCQARCGSNEQLRV